jgi:hypothetical protein
MQDFQFPLAEFLIAVKGRPNDLLANRGPEEIHWSPLEILQN